MRLKAIYPSLALVILVIALIPLSPMLKPKPSNTLNPYSAPQVVNLNEIKRVLVLLNETIINLNASKVNSIIQFINASQAAYSNGQAPPINTAIVNTMVSFLKSGYVNSPIIQSIPLVNVSELGKVALSSSGLINLTKRNAGLLLTTQYMTTALGNSTINQLVNTIASSSGAQNTVLTLSLSPSEALVGSRVMVQGRLTLTNGTGLGNQTIVIFINGRLTAVVLTNASGYYSINVTVPYVYVNETDVTAVFIPVSSGLAGSVASSLIRLIYNETRLMIHINNETVLWGDSLVIWGNVTGDFNRLIIIHADGLTFNTTSFNGFFNVTIPTSVLKPGNVNLTINVEPYLTYAPVNYTINATIIGVKPRIRINTRILLAGFGNELLINLQPWLKRNATLVIHLGSLNETITANSPTAVALVKVPWTQGMGFSVLNVTVEPDPPIEATSMSVRVVLINIAQLAIILLIVPVALLGVRLSRMRQKQHIPASPVLSNEVKVIEEAVASSAPPARLRDPNVKAIVGYMAQAINAVSLRTGVKLTRGQTLREYLMVVGPRLNDEEVKGLRSLINLTEEALYSPRLPSESDVERALAYLTMVIKQ